MAAKEIIVKKYVVQLSGEERQHLACIDPQRQAARAASDEGAYFVEGRYVSEPVKDGATTKSSRPWRPAHPWFTGSANNWWKKASKLC